MQRDGQTLVYGRLIGFLLGKGGQTRESAPARGDGNPLQELHADGSADGNVVAGVGEQSGRLVAAEHLDLVAVAAAAEQEVAVGGDVELSWMGCRGLIADRREQAWQCVDGEDGDALGLQAVA